MHTSEGVPPALPPGRGLDVSLWGCRGARGVCVVRGASEYVRGPERGAQEFSQVRGYEDMGQIGH